MADKIPLKMHQARRTCIGLASPSVRFIITGVFFVWTLWRVFHHELWRDETGVWLHLVHTDSIPLLLNNLDYGGHPLLWPILVYPLARLSGDPFLMQCLHMLCATLSAFLILRYAPFTLLEKILLLFGYYLSYEYAVITRHYALSVLFLAAYLSFRTSKHAFTLPAALCLALLAETNVYGTIMAAALLIGWMVERELPYQYGRTDTSRGPGGQGALLVILGIIIAVVDMKPPGDYVFARTWHFTMDGGLLVQTLAKAWRGLVPVPEFHDHFWNSNILSAYPLAAAFAGVLLLAVSLWSFRQQRGVLIAMLIAVIGLLSFTYLKYQGYQRHHGFFFLTVFAAYWLYRNHLPDFSEDDKVFRKLIWKPMLLIQLFVAFYASYMDYRLPFSGSKAAAEYLVRHNLQDRPIAVYPMERVKPLALFFDQGLYHLGSGMVEKYAVFNKTSYVKLSEQEVLDRARGWLAQTEGQGVFILAHGNTLPEDEFRRLALVPETSIVGTERYSIYIAQGRKRAPGSTAESERP